MSDPINPDWPPDDKPGGLLTPPGMQGAGLRQSLCVLDDNSGGVKAIITLGISNNTRLEYYHNTISVPSVCRSV